MWNGHCPGSIEGGLILISLVEISRLVCSVFCLTSYFLRYRYEEDGKCGEFTRQSSHPGIVSRPRSELSRLSQHRDWKDRGTFWLFPRVGVSVWLSVRSIRLVPASTRTSLRIASKLRSLPFLLPREERSASALHSCEIMSPMLDGRTDEQTDRPYCRRWLGV